ncbi:MAG: formyltransferase family protein [Phycisphaerae bacterium]|nr:formyltransferase family protein [Phycisphaerae bacterium]
MNRVQRPRIVVLTCLPRDIASRCLPELCANRNIEVVGVVRAHGGSPGQSRVLRRKLKKLWRIGPLGALNGVRMRAWYVDLDAPEIRTVCAAHGVPLFDTEFLNSEPTREIFRTLRADLGLSLGNGYIAETVYSIPRCGMVNIHTEILPQFQGAQSIIWPIYENVPDTGFTIHQVARKIDAGDILLQQRYPIEFRPTLRETVEHNMRRARERIPSAFSEVCEHYDELRARAVPQTSTTSYTTPSYWQFRRMVRNNAAMYRQSRGL